LSFVNTKAIFLKFWIYEQCHDRIFSRIRKLEKRKKEKIKSPPPPLEVQKMASLRVPGVPSY